MDDEKKITPESRYQIVVDGLLDETWSDWFSGFSIQTQGNHTILTGPVRDQSAMHGILERIRDMNLKLISVNKVEDNLEFQVKGGE